MRIWKTLSHLLREKRTILGIALLALVAAFTGWRRVATPPTGSADPPPALTRDSDYTLERFDLTVLNERGRLAVSLTGATMEHDPGNERSLIEAPEATVTGPEDTRWEGSARQGWIADDGGELTLSGSVRLIRMPSESVAPLELTTETLTLFPDLEQAMTAAPVTIVQPGARLQGVGMQVDLARGSYELNTRVRGIYDTPDSS